MESERLEASCVNDNRDIIMAQLIWSERGCELAHPGLWRHLAPYIHPTVPCIGNPVSLAEWGSVLSLIEIDVARVGPTPEETDPNGDKPVASLEDLESDSDFEEEEVAER